MGQWQNTRSKDVVDVPPALDAGYKADPAWQPYKAPTEAKAPAKAKDN